MRPSDPADRYKDDTIDARIVRDEHSPSALQRGAGSGSRRVAEASARRWAPGSSGRTISSSPSLACRPPGLIAQTRPIARECERPNDTGRFSSDWWPCPAS
jgi:hypothetical protein